MDTTQPTTTTRRPWYHYVLLPFVLLFQAVAVVLYVAFALAATLLQLLITLVILGILLTACGVVA